MNSSEPPSQFLVLSHTNAESIHFVSLWHIKSISLGHSSAKENPFKQTILANKNQKWFRLYIIFDAHWENGNNRNYSWNKVIKILFSFAWKIIFFYNNHKFFRYLKFAFFFYKMKLFYSIYQWNYLNLFAILQNIQKKRLNRQKTTLNINHVST